MIAALILAAGQSKRMGSPKLLLPWRGSTVLGHIIQVFKSASVGHILVVTGGDKDAVEEITATLDVATVHNPDFADTEMLGSLQVGLRALGAGMEAALIALGDQPQIEEHSVRRIVQEYARTAKPLIVPSYQMHRGHPWLIGNQLWDAILAMQAPATPRDFLQAHAAEIHYLEMDTPTILLDLDTPEDYLKSQT